MTSKIIKQERQLLLGQLRLISSYPSILGLNESIEIYAKHVFHILMTTVKEWSFEETESVWKATANTHFDNFSFTFEHFSKEDITNDYWENPKKSSNIIREELALILHKLRNLSQDNYPHIAKWVDHLIEHKFEFINPLFADEVLANLIINSFVDEEIRSDAKKLYKEKCKVLIRDSPNDLMGYVGLRKNKRIFPHPVHPTETEQLKLGVKEILVYLANQGISY